MLRGRDTIQSKWVRGSPEVATEDRKWTRAHEGGIWDKEGED